MKDRKISASCTVAYGAWVVAFILWGVGWGVESRGLLTLSILLGGIAVTATVRTYFLQFTSSVRRAFDSDVTPMRRS